MESVFLSPHNDDETLFGSFTIQKEQPDVIVVFGDFLDPTRTHETQNALRALGHRGEYFEWETDNILDIRIGELIGKYNKFYAPLPEENGNPEHNLLGEIVKRVLPNQDITYYLTYTWPQGRSTSANKVDYTPEMVLKKIIALRQYESQMLHPERMDHFLYPQWEYYA